MKKRKRKLYIWRTTRHILITLFTGFIIIYMLAGSTITFNPDKAKETIWDKVKKGVGIAKEVASIVK